MINNEQLKQVATEYGTPLYVYDAAQIKSQYEILATAFESSNCKFFYASKALTNISILKYIKHIGCNVDCSSINEAKLALHAGFEKERILYTTNGIAFSEIQEAVALGVNVNIDSLSNLEKFGATYGNNYPVGIRLRPNIMAGGNLKISTGHDKSKFGIPVTQIDAVSALKEKYNLNIYAVHIHTGSEIKDVAVFVEGLDVLFNIIPHFETLKVIDLGGGFKVPYKEGDAATDINLLAKELHKAVNAFQQKIGKQFEIWFEPGKFLVSSSGYFVTQVNVIKETGNTTFASVNSGFNHLIRPMFYDAYHEIENISNSTGEKHTYTITGNLCETDNFALDRSITTISEGDLLVFKNAGAYCFEMASNFNSRLKPAEVLFINNEFHIIRNRDVFEDLLLKQVKIEMNN
jgi:diaminopimelate decarboxylase